MTDPNQGETWQKVYRAGPVFESWDVEDEDGWPVAHCSREPDADRIIADHAAATKLAAAERELETVRKSRGRAIEDGKRVGLKLAERDAEADALAARLEELAKAVKAQECAECMALDGEDHAANCAIGEALRKYSEKNQ